MRIFFSLSDVRVSQTPPPLPTPQRPVWSGFSDPPPGGVSRPSFVTAPQGFSGGVNLIWNPQTSQISFL